MSPHETIKPEPLRLAFFLTPRRIWTGIPQWHQVEQWWLEGSVTLSAPDGGRVLVTITDAGREGL